MVEGLVRADLGLRVLSECVWRRMACLLKLPGAERAGGWRPSFCSRGSSPQRGQPRNVSELRTVRSPHKLQDTQLVSNRNSPLGSDLCPLQAGPTFRLWLQTLPKPSSSQVPVLAPHKKPSFPMGPPTTTTSTYIQVIHFHLWRAPWSPSL